MAEAVVSSLQEQALAHHRINSSSWSRFAWKELASGPGSHLSCYSVNFEASRTPTGPLRPRAGGGEGSRYD